MCGIFGYWNISGQSLSDDEMKKMGAVIEHRGPDGQGFYNDGSFGLGNQRLAIIDVEHGKQPFFSDDGQVVVVQNGEIFNHIELANELATEGISCTTSCDTEVILRIYEKYGINGISKLNGMFAIAILDKKLNKLFLIRDRVGEKPLYFHYDGSRVLFGSEIKSILSVTGKLDIDYGAMEQFFAFNYIPTPKTIFQGVKHVPPGCYLETKLDSFDVVKWWKINHLKQLERTEEEWMSDFNKLLDDAVAIRLRSDVPFGAFLSGGVDSSTVVGLMSKHMSKPVKTFSIGFDDPKYDESPYAEEAALRFKTEHVLEKVSPNLLALWEKVIYHSEQPHGDVSFMPTYKVAELASKQVKMVLTGDGADELFAGYDKYKNFFRNSENYSDQDFFETAYAENLSLFSKARRDELFSNKVKEQLNASEDVSLSRLKPLFLESRGMDRINQALYIDTMLLLSGNNLVKPDRTGMAVSIENRSPFLDYRIIELAFTMPGSLKLNGRETKYIYKKAVSDLIGHNLAYRQKQMFTVPIGNWFKDELKTLCEDLLFSDKTTKRGFFDYEYVGRLFKQHLNDEKNFTREIRALMSFELWCRVYLD